MHETTKETMRQLNLFTQEESHIFELAAAWRYLKPLGREDLPEPAEAASRLLETSLDMFREYNAEAPEGYRLEVPEGLTPIQLAELTLKYHDVRMVPEIDMRRAPRKDCDLVIYQTDGPDKGIYTIDTYKAVEEFQPGLSIDMFLEVKSWMRCLAKRGRRCTRKDLVPVNNGIFNCKTKKLMPFSPKYVFLNKCCVDYVEGAKNPVIHNAEDGTDWDMESWMEGLSDDPETAGLLWEVARGVVMPEAKWGRYAVLYTGDGQDSCDRDTYSQLLWNLRDSGKDSYANTSRQDYNAFFVGTESAHATDDPFNDAANWSYNTEDGWLVDLRSKCGYICRLKFKGMVVQSTDKLPQLDGEEICGRLLPVPLTKCSTGVERTYIKDDYVGRSEVLEYVLWRVLNTCWH